MTNHLKGGKRRRSRSRQYRGGSGAAEFGQSVYGSGGSQHAVSNIDNTIAMNHIKGGSALAPSQLGGDLAFTEITGGGHPLVKGGAMIDIAVPAALVLANNAYGRTTTGPVHMIGNVGRSVGKRLNRSVGSVKRGLSRSVRFSPFNRRKSQRKSQRKRRRTRGGKVRGG